MSYTSQEILQYIREEDVKFIRLAFCDVYGTQKNISIMPGELERAFTHGIAIDASAIAGFGGEVRSDLYLHPDPSTISVLPWRPEHGRVVRMFCDITYPDSTVFEADTRSILKRAVEKAAAMGYRFDFGPAMEFYLFLQDDLGEPTLTPYDKAGYMDIAPADKGENVRREICLTLEQMGFRPESSHHEEGPGQNEIDFHYADALTAADNTVTFRSVVHTIAARNGLSASFAPKPLKGSPGNGMHLNFSVHAADGSDALPAAIAGIMRHISAMTLFLNPKEQSYSRLGSQKAPAYITWGHENRSQLIRIPSAGGQYRRAELRSPDSFCNPYLAMALIIYAALSGIEQQLTPPQPVELDLFHAPAEQLKAYNPLPGSLKAAVLAAQSSDFIRTNLPGCIVASYCI